ncbi:MAG TPA: hypothetical protein VGB90_05915 [Alphaproteobacteria bacterium]
MSSSRTKTKTKAKPKLKPAAAAPVDIDAAASAALAAAEQALRDGTTANISDETVQRLLTAGARLYSTKSELEDRWFSPFVSAESVTATDVVMNVCEMLRAADLNIFDLAMWFRRPRPGMDR